MKAILGVNNLGYIGKDNEIMWRCTDDFVHFKKMTMGATLLVGHNTASKLPPLKGRTIIVDDRTYYSGERGDDHIWCIGGKKTYEKYAEFFTEIHISHINDDSIGDVMMPDLKGLNPNCKIYHYYFDTNDKKPKEPITVEYTTIHEPGAGFQGGSKTDGDSGFRS